jgi:putative ABC transport system permease protein
MSYLQALVASIRLALKAVARAKLRAALTVLGILIGIAAVVVVTALGTGARDSIARKFESMGSNMLFVRPQPTQSSGARTKGQGRLTELDGRAVAHEATSVAAIAPQLNNSAQLVYGDQNAATSVIGTSLPYFGIVNHALARGALWTEQDERSKARVIVLGATPAETLFGNQDPVGAIVRVGRHPYRVLGVLVRKGPNPFGEDQDDQVFMPSGTFRSRVRPTAPGRVDTLIVSATTPRSIDRAKAQTESILRQRHRIFDWQEPDFVVRSMAEFREKQESIYEMLSMLLVTVAAVSLVVGGIGVMNIMLVSVTERTREIGIRMAIGAGEADIRLQFLVEAVVLTMIGGAAGAALGLAGTVALIRALEWPMSPPLGALGVAFATSAAIGVVFGFLPARRAAALDPIDALRQE